MQLDRMLRRDGERRASQQQRQENSPHAPFNASVRAALTTRSGSPRRTLAADLFLAHRLAALLRRSGRERNPTPRELFLHSLLGGPEVSSSGLFDFVRRKADGAGKLVRFLHASP